MACLFGHLYGRGRWRGPARSRPLGIALRVGGRRYRASIPEWVGSRRRHLAVVVMTDVVRVWRRCRALVNGHDVSPWGRRGLSLLGFAFVVGIVRSSAPKNVE